MWLQMQLTEQVGLVCQCWRVTAGGPLSCLSMWSVGCGQMVGQPAVVAGDPTRTRDVLGSSETVWHPPLPPPQHQHMSALRWLMEPASGDGSQEGDGALMYGGEDYQEKGRGD